MSFRNEAHVVVCFVPVTAPATKHNVLVTMKMRIVIRRKRNKNVNS